MGYWSEHPMAGDPPMDACDELLGRYDINKDKYYFERPDSELRSMIEGDLEELMDNAEEMDTFVLPFIVCRYGVKVAEEHIPRLLEMIGDGGGAERGYEQDCVGDLSNDFNGLKSPQDYCDKLRFYFRNILAGELPYACIEEQGLLDTIAIKLNTGHTGLINVN